MKKMFGRQSHMKCLRKGNMTKIDPVICWRITTLFETNDIRLYLYHSHDISLVTISASKHLTQIKTESKLVQKNDFIYEMEYSCLKYN